MNPLTLTLASPDETEAFGRALALAAQSLCAEGSPLPVMGLRGDLGLGKTTLARGLVAALPGGERAEFSSPSFTLCNSYPTTPPVLHADLYRLPDGCGLPDELADELDTWDEAAGRALLLLEWPERLAAPLPDCVDIFLDYGPQPLENLDIPGQPCERERLVKLTAHGEAACRLAAALAGALR